MTIPGVDYFVFYEEFPLTVKGLVTPNDDSTFSIFLNSRLPESCRKEVLDHEVKHIDSDDFYSDRSIEEIENL